MKESKFHWNGYWQPTPIKIRKIADAIASACVFSGGLTSLNGHPLAGTIIFISGFLAKMLSNFYTNVETTT